MYYVDVTTVDGTLYISPQQCWVSFVTPHYVALEQHLEGQTVEVGVGGDTAGVYEGHETSGQPADGDSLRARLDTHIQRLRQYPRRVAPRSRSGAN